MRKMYIQPEIEISQLAAMNIVCASGELEETNDIVIGQAPARDPKLF